MKLVKRAAWGARPATSSGNAISSNPAGVAVHWEGVRIGTGGHEHCGSRVLSIQRFHMSTRGYADVAYNFLVCSHGFIYEGRGIGKGSAANGTTKGNLDYYAVCGLVGPADKNGPADPITPELLVGISEAIGACRAAGAGRIVLGHRDLFVTACPGDKLYAWLKSGVVPPTSSTPIPTTVPTSPKPVSVPVSGRPPQIAVDGIFGQGTIKRFQQWAGVTQDGRLGPISWKAIQAKCGAGQDGVAGPLTWKAVQRMVGSPADGIPGPATYRALQYFLNTH